MERENFIRDAAIRRVERHVREFGLTETGVGQLALNDVGFMGRLRRGQNVGINTIVKVLVWLRADRQARRTAQLASNPSKPSKTTGEAA